MCFSVAAPPFTPTQPTSTPTPSPTRLTDNTGPVPERKKNKNVSYKPARQADAAGKKCHEEPNSCGKEKNSRATGSRPGLLFWRGRRRRRGPRVSCVYIPKVSCLDERNEPLFVTRKQETLLRIQSAMKPECRMFTDSDFLSRPHCPTSPRPHLLQPLHKFSGTKKTKQNKGMRGVHGFGITFKKKMKKKNNTQLEAAKTVTLCFMSDIHSTLSTCVRVCTCVCPRSRLFPWGAPKKTKQFVLFGKGLTCVRLFSRENVRGSVRLLFGFWFLKEKNKKKYKKINAECTRVFTSVFRGRGRRVRLHPSTSAVCHGSTGRFC